MSDLTVANEILKQMGGAGRLKAMIGAHSYVGGDNFLGFAFKAKSPFNRVRIELTPMDVYTVTFSKAIGSRLVRQESRENVYCDNLKGVFESATGLYLSMGRISR